MGKKKILEQHAFMIEQKKSHTHYELSKASLKSLKFTSIIVKSIKDLVKWIIGLIRKRLPKLIYKLSRERRKIVTVENLWGF